MYVAYIPSPATMHKMEHRLGIATLARKMQGLKVGFKGYTGL